MKQSNTKQSMPLDSLCRREEIETPLSDFLASPTRVLRTGDNDEAL